MNKRIISHSLPITGRWTLLFLTSSLLILSAVNSAAEEREIQITFGPAYASLPAIEEGVAGFGGGLQVTYKFNEFWLASVGGVYSYHLPFEEDSQINLFSAYMEVIYNIDVIDVIPFACLGATVHVSDKDLFSDNSSPLAFGIKGGLGFDYRRSKNWSIGIELNYHAFIPDITVYPVFITALIRISIIIGLDSL